MTLMQVRTTAEFECDSRGVILSANKFASVESCGTYDIKASMMYACDHSLHSGMIETILDALV